MNLFLLVLTHFSSLSTHGRGLQGLLLGKFAQRRLGQHVTLNIQVQGIMLVNAMVWWCGDRQVQ